MASDANLEATASTTIPLADIAPKCWLHITDISLQGDTAVRRHLDLAPSETNDVKQLLLSLPDLADSHARIYDYVAGEVTPQLADYLQPLFHKAPGVQRNSPRLSKSDLRSQWAGESIPTPEWNPLYVPCCDPLVEKQYDRLGRGPKVSLFTCKSIPGDRLLVLYERPPEYKALGPVFAASYPQATPQSSARLRIVFVKLLLLALSQLHIERLTDVCYRTFPSTPHELLYRGEADVPQTIARIRNCTEYCKHVDQLVAMTRLTIDNLELEFLNAVPTTLAEYLLEVSASSSQLAQISRDNTHRYESAWMAYRDTLNVHESQGIKRLTLLATIFLPLSLSASILAMNTRFRDLHLLLFDFVGVFFLLGSLALMTYAIIATGSSISEYIQRVEVSQKFKQTAPRSLVAGAPIISFRGSFETTSRKIFVMAWIGATMMFIQRIFVIAWIGVTMMFLQGMLPDTTGRTIVYVTSLFVFFVMVAWIVYHGRIRMNHSRTAPR